MLILVPLYDTLAYHVTSLEFQMNKTKNGYNVLSNPTAQRPCISAFAH